MREKQTALSVFQGLLGPIHTAQGRWLRAGDPDSRPLRLGSRLYVISAVNSFGGSSVWLLKVWMAHQSWFAVAATPLADSTPSDHDSPNVPATARLVYVIAHPAARHHGLGLE